MKSKVFIISLLILSQFLFSCSSTPESATNNNEMITFSKVLDTYYNERMRLFPLEATTNGDYRYNDKLPVDISTEYRDTLKNFYSTFLDSLRNYSPDQLSEQEKISYEVLHWDLELGLEGLQFKDNLMPVNQFWGMPLTFGQLGSGKSIQPFRNTKDYDNWLMRVHGFYAWCDTAISNMKKGMAEKIVPPRILMDRVLPQMQAMITDDVTKSLFYKPIENFPDSVNEPDRKRLTAGYRDAIKNEIIPSYKKLYDFIKNDYIKACRETAGISDIPGGRDYYRYLAKFWTTTDLTPDEIFETGQNEVKRLRDEMEKIMLSTGFKGSQKEFFTFLNTDKQFFPFTSAEAVLDSFRNIYAAMEPALNTLFDVKPKTKFEIRETEKFREASASAEYIQGTADGSRPGVFYVPIPDPRKFNTFGMEDLFLHEAIPGHHYQISLQQENDSLPSFRRYIWYGAFGEGWALYTESLGTALGLYKNPYQHFAALSEEMHRAIRLVVDVGIHLKGWTRDQAIQFSLDNEGESKEAITAEIERYMAIPGQALSYKIGQMKILELRAKAEKALGKKFNMAKFHDAILENGCLPLSVLEDQVNQWIESQKGI
ncbi:MAG: DUF885 domain-containing protein [Bacteroidia bacterium]|nr:DUF885 domain-containing protein [Bacteroidia bacterium]